MKSLIKYVVMLAAVILFIVVANGVIRLFLNKSKDVAVERLNKNVQKKHERTSTMEAVKKN